MAVVVILGILAGIAVPSVIGVIEKSKKDVCDVNVLQLERMYETYLDLESIEHSDVVFVQYLQDYGQEICPEHGDISYVDGEVHCSLHPGDNEGGDSDEEGESVPFL
jgi:Tfp pilus assembly protein PilE